MTIALIVRPQAAAKAVEIARNVRTARPGCTIRKHPKAVDNAKIAAYAP